jgi:hypothetical protein
MVGLGGRRVSESVDDEGDEQASKHHLPNCSTALFRAVSSWLKASCPALAHKPRRRPVLVAMAAGMARVGSLAVPAWMVVKRRTELKPEVPGRFLILLNSASKSCWDLMPFGPVPPVLKPRMAPWARVRPARAVVQRRGCMFSLVRDGCGAVERGSQ